MKVEYAISRDSELPLREVKFEVEGDTAAVLKTTTSFIEMWAEARRHGTSGVPSIRRLAIDAEEIGEMLKELAYALAEVAE